MNLGGDRALSYSARPKARAYHFALAVASMVFTVGVALAGSAHGQICAQEFDLPDGSAPAGITTGPDGNIWFTEAGANKIGRISPSGSPLEPPDFKLEPQHGSSPVGITRGPDGALWFTIEFWVDRTGVSSGRIGRITTSGDITSYAIAPGQRGQPHGIVTGPDGALWFTFFNRPALGRITTAGVVTVHPLPVSYPEEFEAHSITVGPDGALWFTDFRRDRILRYVPGNPPAFREHGLTAGSDPTGSSPGPTESCGSRSKGATSLGG